MKIQTVLLVAAAWTWLGTARAQSSDYQMQWSSFTGGGRLVQSATYVHLGGLTGVAPGRASSHDYTVQLGLAEMPEAPQPSGGPLLSITLGRGHVIVTWPAQDQFYVLEQATDLGPRTRWTEVSAPYDFDRIQYSVVLPVEKGKRFFRLRSSDPTVK